MLHFLSSVRQSMLSCRRRQPIPQDFSRALSQHNLTVSALTPHLQPPVSPSLSQVCLEPVTEAEPPHPDLLPFLGPALSGAVEKQQAPYIPSHFPGFPSKHTYKATPEFVEREEDPRTVRERATEEGRLGEEALRRLIGAGKAGDNRHNSFIRRKGSGGPRQKMEEMWLQTMMATSQDEGVRDGDIGIDGGGQGGEHTAKEHGPRAASDNLELGAIVNWEKTYWRVGAVGYNSRSRVKDPTAKKADVLMNDGAMIMAS